MKTLLFLAWFCGTAILGFYLGRLHTRIQQQGFGHWWFWLWHRRCQFCDGQGEHATDGDGMVFAQCEACEGTGLAPFIKAPSWWRA